MKRALEWNTKDISFVFCIPSEIDIDQSFRSRVEVDVYFCRKYIVHLQQNLSTCLERLPFLPLSRISSRGAVRPPSAQTLLQHNNLRADLASALVVPAKRSASSILDSCLEGAFGEPEKITQVSAAYSETKDDNRVQTTLRSISIENFRAYRKKKEFALGSAITFLYGPNGFGKTSFFDAIDFAVTGGVGRFEKMSGDLTKAAKHLDSGEEPAVVSLTFERDGNVHVITRDLADPNNALLDGVASPRKEVLSRLTGGAAAGADRVDNMVALFRATHLFSQDSQELTKHVEEKCELPADIVSRMLAFEDYVSGLKKAEEVLNVGRKKFKDSQAEAQGLTVIVNTDSEELRRLENLVAENSSPAEVDDRFIALRNAISAADFNLSGIDQRDTKSLRALLESSAVKAAAMRENVSKALEQVEGLKTLREQIEPLHAQMLERNTQVEDALSATDDAESSLAARSKALEEAKVQEQTVQNQRDWLLWAESVQPNYVRLNTQALAHTNGRLELENSLEHQRGALARAHVCQQEAAATVRNHEFNLEKARTARYQLLSVSETAKRWVHQEPRLIAAQARESELRNEIDAKLLLLGQEEQAVSAQESIVAQCERELNSSKDKQTTLKGLIAELRTHVDGSSCLLCGYDHGSQHGLLAEIDRRMGQGELVVLLSEKFAFERVKLQAQVSSLKTLSYGLTKEQEELKKVTIEREQLEQQKAFFETALNTVNIMFSKNSNQQLAQLSKESHEVEQDALIEMREAHKHLVVAEAELSTMNIRYMALEGEYEALTSSLEDAKQRMKELIDQSNIGNVNLASGLASLSEKRRDAEVRLSHSNEAVLTAIAEHDVQKLKCASAKAALATARTNQQRTSEMIVNFKSKIQSLILGLNTSGFDGAVNVEQLQNQLQINAQREVTALGLGDRVAELEVAIDTAATSAAFQNLRERVKSNKKLLEQADRLAQKVKPWIAFFEGITKLLSSEQAVATKQFITQYGPRTAIIQQRLRPVYGFGKIEISSKDSTIGIRVNRNGEELKPTHYFSQSQIQTLVLGLFLTACSSQTWSGFSSIMMDDPVTHFDDLNTYALLDLILGLQGSTEGARQFVISTCDEKLLQLARQKFKHMGAQAKFYRFSALGAEGPMVSEILS